MLINRIFFAFLFLLSFTFNFILFAEKEFTLSTIDQRFKVTSPNLSLSHGLILALEQAGKDFDILTGEEKDWRSPLYLKIVLNSDQEGFKRQVKIVSDHLIFLLEASLKDLEKEELFTSVSELLCYELSTREIQNFNQQGALPILPFWLIDGIGQNLNRERQKDLIRIVQGVVKHERAPTLLTVQSWKEPSEIPLERWYQKAFNFWIVRELTYGQKERLLLGKWIRAATQQTEIESLTYWTNLVSGGKWWITSLHRGANRSHEVFLTYEATQVVLKKLLPTEIKIDKTGKIKLISFNELFSISRDSNYFMRLREKQQALWRLIERGNVFYQPIVQAYYQIVDDLLSGKVSKKEFEERVQATDRLQERMEKDYESMQDYLNWFEVTQFRVASELEFSSYFNWITQFEAKEMFQQLKEREKPFSILNWQR